MKKYIAPSLQVVNIENNTILAGSNPNVGVNPNADPVNTMGARGHRGNLLDFDDED